MSERNVYQIAFKLFLERIESKTSWGKEEIKKLMLACLMEAGDVQGGKGA